MYRRTLTPFLALLALALLVGACGGGQQASQPAASSAPAPAAQPASTGSGTIQGVVAYTDGDPDTPIKMDADPVCAGLHDSPVMTEHVVTADGKLANVFIYIKSGLSGTYKAPAQAVLLDQQGCQYHPHILAAMVGEPFKIRNSDPTLHNIHALPTKNTEFNQGQPFQGMEMEHTFDMPEVMIRIKCDVHPWMNGYMAVMDNPFYAVSAPDGTFSIKNVPAGTYTLEAWHETLGTQTMEVTVGEGGTAEADWQFGE
jgi:plastocyanin